MVDLAGRRVLVCGLGVAGHSAVRALLALGASVAATADGAILDPPPVELLGRLAAVPADIDLVIASPGYRPTHPLLADALARGIAVWGELEFAWQLRGSDPAPWLVLTGTNGKTTTVHQLEAMLRAGGADAVAVGNVGVPVIDAVRAGHDVLAVEASSQQLHFAPSLAPAAGALLNLAPDHLDWHGDFAAYARAKTAVWRGAVAIGNADDRRVAALLAGRTGAVWFTLAEPGPDAMGVIDGHLVSRAFGDDGLVLAAVSDVAPPGRHNVANALAAAALTRAYGGARGWGRAAVEGGLVAFTPDPHRNQLVAEIAGVTWVDDSKATNPHAAQASLEAYPRIVWVAGGQLKGVAIGELVAAVGPRLAGAVLLGQDRAAVAEALARHAPDVPVITVDTRDDGVMTEVVRAAAGLARPGDTVLLAPAAASYDMFAGFAARGAAFVAAVRALEST